MSYSKKVHQDPASDNSPVVEQSPLVPADPNSNGKSIDDSHTILLGETSVKAENERQSEVHVPN